jgi:hypothetical protein
MKKLSRADEEMIDGLRAGRERLLSDPSRGALLSAIRRGLSSISINMYVVSYIPEQYEEIYEVLVDGTTIASVELPRKSVDASIVFKSWALDDYLKRRKGRLSKLARRRLNFAIELANEHRSRVGWVRISDLCAEAQRAKAEA